MAKACHVSTWALGKWADGDQPLREHWSVGGIPIAQEPWPFALKFYMHVQVELITKKHAATDQDTWQSRPAPNGHGALAAGLEASPLLSSLSLDCPAFTPQWGVSWEVLRRSSETSWPWELGGEAALPWLPWLRPEVVNCLTFWLECPPYKHSPWYKNHAAWLCECHIWAAEWGAERRKNPWVLWHSVWEKSDVYLKVVYSYLFHFP